MLVQFEIRINLGVTRRSMVTPPSSYREIKTDYFSAAISNYAKSGPRVDVMFGLGDFANRGIDRCKFIRMVDLRQQTSQHHGAEDYVQAKVAKQGWGSQKG
jgi:hypothetical protein